MRRILVMSMAAAVPAVLPAVAAGAQSRPLPPSSRSHHGSAVRSDRREQAPAGVGVPMSARDASGTGTGTDAAPARPHIELLPLGSPAPVTPAGSGASATPAAPATATSPASATAMPGAAAGPVQESGQAQTRRHGDEPARQATHLVLTTSMGSAAPRTVTLLCDPPGGTHPKAAEACADLARSNGDFTLRSTGRKPRACFMIYSPVRVSAKGRWRGEDVKFTASFPNTCVMHGQTGAIFAF